MGVYRMGRLIILLAFTMLTACAPNKETVSIIERIPDEERIDIVIDSLQSKVVELELRIQALEESDKPKQRRRCR